MSFKPHLEPKTDKNSHLTIVLSQSSLNFHMKFKLDFCNLYNEIIKSKLITEQIERSTLRELYA
jgi:hypothetical protein